MEALVRGLHPLEIKLLLGLQQKERFGVREVSSRLGFNEGQCNQAFSWLTGKSLIQEIERITKTRYELTELGGEYREKGTPEERMIASVKTAGLIGDKYINLSPGGSEDILEPGDAITETVSALDIEDLISRYAFGSVTE